MPVKSKLFSNLNGFDDFLGLVGANDIVRFELETAFILYAAFAILFGAVYPVRTDFNAVYFALPKFRLSSPRDKGSAGTQKALCYQATDDTALRQAAKNLYHFECPAFGFNNLRLEHGLQNRHHTIH